MIGVYWAYDGVQGIGVPPRLYNQIERKLASNLSMSQAAELFAQINVAMADAGIDAWRYKYLHNLWRPVIGIRHESAGEGECFWAPLGAPQTNRLAARAATPPFPAYPSGHATFGAALFQTLRLRSGPGAPRRALAFRWTAARCRGQRRRRAARPRDRAAVHDYFNQAPSLNGAG